MRAAKFSTAVLVALLIAFSAWQVKLLFDDRIYDGVTLDNIPMGQMSGQEALKTIEHWRQNQSEWTITLADANTSFKLRPGKDIDFDIDAQAMLDAAFHIGRRGNVKNRLTEIYRTKKDGRPIPVIIKYNKIKLENILYKLQTEKNKPPKNVAISLLTKKITPEEWGRKLDAELLKAQLIAVLRQLKDARLDLPMIPVAPAMTAANLDKNGLRELMSSYSTTFNAGDRNRTGNIKLAAKKINGCLLFPGQVFSFNEVVGPRDKASGFKEAMEIVDGEFVPGVGGGVCQVSSTLYNAVLLAGLNVIERTNHSRPLRYVPLGRDATVAYDSIDFKFVNNNLLPVMILSETSGSKLHVGILGRQFFQEHSEIMTFEVVTANEKVILPLVLEKEDSALPQGVSEVDNTGSPGYEVGTARITRDPNGKEIKREVLSLDKYLPDNKIVRIGQAQR